MSSIFFYHSKSADKLPGFGTNESLGPTADLNSNFKELSKMKHWRRTLSNFHEGTFQFRGSHYRTAEHAFQGSKIAMVDPMKGTWFTVESGHSIGLGGGELARKNRKLVLLKDDQIREWNNAMPAVLQDILSAKFHQVQSARDVLLATADAELWHGARGVPKARQFALERVREQILQESSGESTTPEERTEESSKRRKLRRT